MNEISIPLKGGKEYVVTQNEIKQYKESYPEIDVEQGLREIRAWNLANPQRQKTSRGIRRHINHWLQQNIEVERLPMWAQTLSAYSVRIKPDMVKVWAAEFKAALNHLPSTDEIIIAIRRFAGYDDYKGFINCADVIKEIKAQRKRTAANPIYESELDISYQQLSEMAGIVQAEADLTKRWDLICGFTHPQLLRDHCDREGIEYKTVWE